MSRGRVFVVGSLHYDIVLNAPHLPARDETVMGENVQFVCGGKGGNQAVAAAQHGADVSFAGAVGKDFFADALLDNLAKCGLETGQILRHDGSASGMSVAIVEPSGDYGAVVASGANQRLNASNIDIPTDTSCLILQNEIPEDVNIVIADRAKKMGAQVVLNAAPMRTLPTALLQNIDVLIVNRVEAAAFFHQSMETIGDAEAALDKSTLPCPAIIITLGGDGLVFSSTDERPHHVPAASVETISSHGAGDAFVGALCSQLVARRPLEDSLKYASAAAALHILTPVDKRSEIGPVDVSKLV